MSQLEDLDDGTVQEEISRFERLLALPRQLPLMLVFVDLDSTQIRLAASPLWIATLSGNPTEQATILAKLQSSLQTLVRRNEAGSNGHARSDG